MTIWHRDMAWVQSKAKGTARLVLMVIGDAAGDDDLATLTAKQIAAKAHCGIRSVPRAVARLEALGELEVVSHASGEPTVYRVCLGQG